MFNIDVIPLTSKQTAIVSITCLIAWLKGLSKPELIVLNTASMWFLCFMSVSRAGFTQSSNTAWCGREILESLKL